MVVIPSSRWSICWYANSVSVTSRVAGLRSNGEEDARACVLSITFQGWFLNVLVREPWLLLGKTFKLTLGG